MKAPLPINEAARLEALRRYEILDTEAERDFDDIALLASHICDTPISLISLVDEDRQWFKSKVGMTGSETSRDIAFCAHGILQPDFFEVEDAGADNRFAANPLVTDNLKIRFYAGAPLVTPDGHTLGMLCVNDLVPRKLTPAQKAALQALSRQVVAQLELRNSLKELRRNLAESKVVAESLRDSEEKFRQVAENITDVFYMTSPDMQQMLYVSPAYEHVWGRSVERLYTNPQEWAEAILPEDRERVWTTFGRLAADEPSVSAEFRIVRPDGAVRWILSRGFQVRDATGKGIRITGIATDITERKQAETAAQRSQKQLRDLIDGVGPSMFVGLMTLEGILIECNRPALAAAGLKPEDVLGKPFEKTYWWAYSPEIQQQLRESIARAAGGESSRYDVQVRAGENQLIDVDFSLQPIRDETGEVAFLVPSASVITERKAAEAETRALAERLTSTLESLTDGFFTIDREWHFTYLNRAAEEMFRLSRTELLGNHIWAKFPEARNTISQQQYERALRDNIAVQFETFYQPLGTWFDARAFPSTQGLAVYFRDITERKLSEAALEEAHKEVVEASRKAGMAEVATGVLHNVGNVLNSVNVASSCLADSLRNSKAANLGKVVTMLREHATDLGAFLTGDPKGKQLPGYLAQLAEHLAGEQAAALKDLAGLQKNIEHIKDIVSMQQSFAKVSGVRETLAVSDLVEDALKMNSTSLLRHDIQISKDFAPVPQLSVEKHKVLQILVNLIRNAKHACDETGRPDKHVTIRVAQGAGCMEIAVTDNGVGIPPENLARIFAHGFTTKRDGHGFGLHSGALAAKEMGGSLNAQSGGVGHGATFTLELPLTEKPKEHLCTA